MKHILYNIATLLFCSSYSFGDQVYKNGCHYDCHVEKHISFVPQTYTKYVSDVYYTLEKKEHTRKTPISKSVTLKKSIGTLRTVVPTNEPKCVGTIEFGILYQAILDGRAYQFDFGDKDTLNEYVKEGEIVDSNTISYQGKNIKECASSFPSAGNSTKEFENLIWVPHYFLRSLSIQRYIPIEYEELICRLLYEGYSPVQISSHMTTNDLPVPEPSTLLLFSTGIVVLLTIKRRNW